MFSNLSRAEIYNRKVKGKSIYKIELKSTTFVKLTYVIINRNNFRARIFNQIQIPARETSRSLGSRLGRSPLAIRDRLVGKSIFYIIYYGYFTLQIMCNNPLYMFSNYIMLFMSWEVIQPKNTVQHTFSHFWPRHLV